MDNLLPLLWTAALLFLVGCINSIIAFIFKEKIFTEIHFFIAFAVFSFIGTVITWVIISNIKLII